MEVFGENYDLTPDQQAEVSDWMKTVTPEQAAEIPVPFDNAISTGHHEVKRLQPSPELDVALALQSIQGTDGYKSGLTGRPRHVEFYELIHPLGGNLYIKDAAAKIGIHRITAHRWLNRLRADNPDRFDLDRWPHKRQLDVYRLIHPALGGLTRHEAAKALKSSYQHVCDCVARMRREFPKAFAFENVPVPTVVPLNTEIHDEQVQATF